MASSIQCSVWVPSLPNTNTIRFLSVNPNSVTFSSSSLTRIRASSSSPTVEEAAMNIDNLRRFINLNSGKWNGSFYVTFLLLFLFKLENLCWNSCWECIRNNSKDHFSMKTFYFFFLSKSYSHQLPWFWLVDTVQPFYSDSAYKLNSRYYCNFFLSWNFNRKSTYPSAPMRK